jgi:hypothetical protein
VTRRSLSTTGCIRSVQRCSRGAQTRVCHRRVRSLAGPTHPVARGTDASGQAPKGTAEREGLIGHGGTSGQLRSNASGHEKPFLDPFCTRIERRVCCVWSVLQYVRSVLHGRRHCAICASSRFVTVGALSRPLRSGIRH